MKRISLAVALAVGVAVGAPTVARAEPAEGCRAEQGCGAVVGRVRAEGRREAVAGARVVIIPVPQGDEPPAWTLGATTDAEGHYAIPRVPAGPVRVVVLREGFDRLEHDAQVVAGASITTELYLRNDEEGTYRTVVAGPRPIQDPRPPSTLLSREEIATLPGTQGDPLRALQNLPGVARPPGGLGFLVLRGAPPWQSLNMVGEHPVPRAFHAWPLAAVVQADAVEEVELVPSNASARYGPVTGGIIKIHPRRPRTDATHGHGRIDLMGVDAEVDGPLGPKRKASYLVAARRGWIDGVLRVVEPIVEQGMTLPGLWDYQAWVVVPRGRAELEVRALGAGDRVRSRYRDSITGEIEDAFEFQSQFLRFDFVARWRGGRTKMFITPSVRLRRDRALWPNVTLVEREEIAPGWRAEIEGRLAPRARLVIGTDGEVVPNRSMVDQLNEGQGFSPPGSVRGDERNAGVETRAGAYALVHFGTGRWRVSPGVRVQTATITGEPMAAIDPRLGARWSISDRVTVDLGVGHYSYPRVTTLSSNSSLVNQLIGRVAPTVRLPGALARAFEPRVVRDDDRGHRWLTSEHASVTVEVELPWDLELRVGAFGRYSIDPRVDGRQVLDGGSLGQTVTFHERELTVDAGGDVLLRKRLSRHLYGWISYTVMRSMQTLRGEWIPGDFDQPHNFLAVASYTLPRNWRIGGRFRVSSGNPYTPVVGAVDLDVPYVQGRQWLLYGTPNGARFPLFHQLDLRLDKQWLYPRATVTGYLDIQNVYNRQNVEAWVYQLDYRSRVGSVGLPVFPSLGVKVDF